MSLHTAVCRCGNTFVREDILSLRCDVCQLLDRHIELDPNTELEENVEGSMNDNWINRMFDWVVKLFISPCQPGRQRR